MKTVQFIVPVDKKETFRYEKESFGYIYNGETIEGSNVTMVFTIDEKMPNYKRIRKIEKDYNRINKKLPLATIIILTIGILSFIGYVCTYSLFDLSFILLIVAILFICLGLISLFTYFYILVKSDKLKSNLLEQARIIIGNTFIVPLPNNVKEENDSTFEIRKAILKK